MKKPLILTNRRNFSKFLLFPFLFFYFLSFFSYLSSILLQKLQNIAFEFWLMSISAALFDLCFETDIKLILGSKQASRSFPFSNDVEPDPSTWCLFQNRHQTDFRLLMLNQTSTWFLFTFLKAISITVKPLIMSLL